LLGVPAVSFFPSEVFLTVDEVMQEMGIEFKSRNAQEIKSYVDKAQKKTASTVRSKIVLNEVLNIIDNIIKENS
jgi:predicted glycosyltransferase